MLDKMSELNIPKSQKSYLEFNKSEKINISFDTWKRIDKSDDFIKNIIIHIWDNTYIKTPEKLIKKLLLPKKNIPIHEKPPRKPTTSVVGGIG